MTSTAGTLPPEITETREWLREVFQQAAKGLPWPYQLGLMLVEQAFATAMFGGLLVSAWVLLDTRQRGSSPATSLHFQRTVAALEEVALGPLPAQLQGAIRHLENLPGGQEVLRQLAVALGPMWGQLIQATSFRGRSNSQRD